MEENVENQQEINGKKLGGVTGKGFMPGQSGNPAGRPKGKTMKEFAREYLMLQSDEEKREWLEKKVNAIDIWKMAEGMPKQDMDVTTDGQPLIVRLNE